MKRRKQERREAGRRESRLEGYGKGGIWDCRDSLLEDTGNKGYIKQGIQEMRVTGNEGYGKGEFRTRRNGNRRDAGHEGYRMQDSWAAEQLVCRTAGMQDWRGAGKVGQV